ncbi:uncharacterized protein B0J16DRAFT_349244 [Fusarium flagelliforme]|uniref:uncharacterized protein n=1 Tax=Fusarium flagelliforme TaxID=2675880 RepID=UPI001E8D3258|nr:uncharacterized protein B0J16DRAFT_349244 [Fusarium flagelliforme]KAH7174828.1 hypothetical protein B0J16DRAFT_349244 [Fusarium flagelliforme]
MSTSTQDLAKQWANPGDILSILLLIGSDIVQKAITQLVGHKIRIPGTKTHLHIAPVAFSFGWATYGFTNLVAAVGSMRLMPTTDCPSILVNSSNGFARDNRSWVLGRILRDHEIHHMVDPRPISEGGRAESIRIDVFHLNPVKSPTCDMIWWLGWATLVTQLTIVTIPGFLYGNWTILLIALAGICLAFVTVALPQWAEEKWATPSLLTREKVTCLTRGNGYLHIMVFIGCPGSWDLERLATRMSIPRAGTRWISLLLAILWICLLVAISGLKEHTWFLIGIGGLGMLHNVLAAGISRDPAASNFHLTKFERAPTIIGIHQDSGSDDADADVDPDQVRQELSGLEAWISTPAKSQGDTSDEPCSVKPASSPSWITSMSEKDGTPAWLRAIQPTFTEPPDTEGAQFTSKKGWNPFSSCASNTGKVIYANGVHGALMELEKWVPNAGLSMVQTFFPAGLQYHDEAIRDNTHKKFWKRAYSTRKLRAKAEEKRRAEERPGGLLEV